MDKQMEQKFILDLDSARRVAAAAEAEADKNKWDVVIAIVDDGGHLMYLQRGKAQPGSIDIAINKAKSALMFRRSTKIWEEIVDGGRPGYLALPGIVPLEGGIPLIYRDQVVGGIGVSGVKSTEDGMIAQVGASAL
jgi:glc operon protein GlcG